MQSMVDLYHKVNRFIHAPTQSKKFRDLLFYANVKIVQSHFVAWVYLHNFKKANMLSQFFDSKHKCHLLIKFIQHLELPYGGARKLRIVP